MKHLCRPRLRVERDRHAVETLGWFWHCQICDAAGTFECRPRATATTIFEMAYRRHHASSPDCTGASILLTAPVRDS